MSLPISGSFCGICTIQSCVGGLQSQRSLLNRLAYFYFLQQTSPKNSGSLGLCVPLYTQTHKKWSEQRRSSIKIIPKCFSGLKPETFASEERVFFYSVFFPSMCQWRSEWPLCALQKITMMTVSCITQLCSKTKSLSGLLDPGRRLLLFRAPTITSNCLSWFYIEPCDDFKNESLFTTSASVNSHSQQTGSLDFIKQQLRLPKNYFCFVCPSVCVPGEKAVNSPAAETSKDTLICLAPQSLKCRQIGKVTRQILSESAWHHSSRLEPFCMATPRLAPHGGSVREAVGRAESSPGRLAGRWQCKPLGGSS